MFALILIYLIDSICIPYDHGHDKTSIAPMLFKFELSFCVMAKIICIVKNIIYRKRTKPHYRITNVVNK